MTDVKDEFLRNLNAKLLKNFSAPQIQDINQALMLCLHGITMTKQCTDLVVHRDDNTKILKYYFAAKQVAGLSKRSLEFYSSTLSDFLNVVGNVELTKVDVIAIQYFLAQKKQKGIKNVTIDNHRRNLSAFFGWLHKNKFRSDNPMDLIPRIKFSKRTREAVPEEDLEKIRQVCDIRERALIEVLLSTGCRVGEIVRLERQQVDLERGEAIVLGKGNKERKVFLNEKAKFYLQQYLATRNDNNPALFVSRKRHHPKKLEISAIEIIIRKVGRRAGVKIFPHKLRHTFATRAINRGMPIEVLQRLLGHESLDTTTIYAKVNDEEVKYSHGKYCY